MNELRGNPAGGDKGDDGSFLAGKFRISSNFVQLAAFLCGLVVTVAAYFMLSFFIQDLTEANRQRSSTEMQETLAERISGFEQSIRTASVILPQYAPMDQKAMAQRLRYSVSGIENFDRLVWLHKEGGDWRLIDLVEPADELSVGNFSLLTENAGRSLWDYILNARINSADDIILATDFPGVKYVQNQAEPIIRERPLVLAKIISASDSENSAIVGVTRLTRAVDSSWIGAKEEISRIAVFDTKSGRPIYYMDRNYSGQEMIDRSPVNDNKMLFIGSSRLEVQIAAGKNRETFYLEASPLLVLVVGMTLTLIVTMYVRSSQRQSIRLQAVNRALSLKNYELNNEAFERERLNQTLHKAEREYKAIIDSVSDIIFEITTKGEIVFLNDSWEKITGFSIDQSINQNLFDMIYPQDQEEQRQNLDQMVRGKRNAYHFFTRLRTSEGAFRSIEMTISMLRQDENRSLRVVGTVTDIEERRRAEKALGEAEKKYRTIVENAAGGIYQVTPEGQFLSANPSMAHILGYDTPEVMLREIRRAHESLYANPRERAQFIHKLEVQGAALNFETQIITRQGQKIWVSENARAVKDDDGNVLYFEGSIENITKRKEVEIKLREAKIQSDLSSRAKSEFLANMSHELRTPLNAIIGFSEIIRDEVLGAIGNVQYKEYVRDIYDSGRKLLSIINEILDVSRIETGDRQLNEGVVDITRVTRSCLDFIRPKLMAEKLVVVNLMEGAVPKVIGEELAIKQIILNLLSNAVKFTGQGGRITLSHEVDHEGQLRISVTDTGVGLDEAEIEKALSPFGQVDTSLGRAGSGAGLGLTLVDSLIKLHGGRLELFSQKGVGTTATIVFPSRRVAQEPKEGDGHIDDGDMPDGNHPTRNLQ